MCFIAAPPRVWRPTGTSLVIILAGLLLQSSCFQEINVSIFSRNTSRRALRFLVAYSASAKVSLVMDNTGWSGPRNYRKIGELFRPSLGCESRPDPRVRVVRRKPAGRFLSSHLPTVCYFLYPFPPTMDTLLFSASIFLGKIDRSKAIASEAIVNGPTPAGPIQLSKS